MSIENLIRRPSPGEEVSTPERARIWSFAVYLVVLTLLFILPLGRLAAHAASSDLHSHILLVPFVSAYLLYLRRGQIPAPPASSLAGTALMSVAGAGALADRKSGV